MSRTPSRPRVGPWLPRALPLLGLLTASCGDAPYGKQPPAPASASAPAADGAAAAADTPEATPDEPEVNPDTPETPSVRGVPKAHEDGKPLGKVLASAPLPLAKILGAPPPEVETFLGEPLPDQKGGTRETCVRYVPERTWFRCKMAWQRYADKTGNFGVVQVTYEDGKAASLAFEKLPGTGPFDHVAALRAVGLELPGTPAESSPAEGVTVWAWWNNEARLVVHGRQYRVRVSAVQGQWERAKVEIILNDTLNADEQKRVIESRGAKGEDEPGQAPGADG